MKLGNYELSILDNIANAAGQVEMRHGQTYELVLRNNGHEKCEAKVTIDGEHVGTWILRPRQRAALQRPANVERLFTAYFEGTHEADAINLDASDDRTGLITCVFTPERQQRTTMYAKVGSCCGQSMGPSSASPVVGTGLSGHSDQKFQTVQGLDLDRGKAVTIHLRLVAADTPQSLSSVRTTPIPPRK